MSSVRENIWRQGGRPAPGGLSIPGRTRNDPLRNKHRRDSGTRAMIHCHASRQRWPRVWQVLRTGESQE
jgi:hypothetical protein